MGRPEHEPLRLLAMIGPLETMAAVATHNREWQMGQVVDADLPREKYGLTLPCMAPGLMSPPEDF